MEGALMEVWGVKWGGGGASGVGRELLGLCDSSVKMDEWEN